jgi:hypothetical protein
MSVSAAKADDFASIIWGILAGPEELFKVSTTRFFWRLPNKNPEKSFSAKK